MTERKSFDELEILSPKELGKMLLGEIIKSRVNTQYIKNLIDAGAPLEAKDNGSRTPLHLAARYNQVGVVKLLIKTGAFIEAQTNGGWTALHFAVYNGHLEVVKALILAGASLEAKDNDDRSSLHWAAHGAYVDIVKALISAGAPLEAKDNVGNTPWDLVDYHIRKGIPVLNPNYNG